MELLILRHWKDLGVDGEIILKRILQKQGRRVRVGLIWLRMETYGGFL
jgi:hypothetical protein